MTSDSTRPTRADHMQRLAQWILCHRLLVCITLLIITATAGYILSHAHLGSSLGKLFFYRLHKKFIINQIAIWSKIDIHTEIFIQATFF